MINAKYGKITYTAAVATCLAAASLLTRWEAVRIIGLTTLTGVGYGIANDMVACRDCIDYFTVGHEYKGSQDEEFRFVKTRDPNLNALAFGPIATWWAAGFAGCILALIARTSLFAPTRKVSLSQLLPYLGLGAVATFAVGHAAARIEELRLRHCSQQDRRGWAHLYQVPEEIVPQWHACDVRNSMGYLSLLVLGITLSVAIVNTRRGGGGFWRL